MTSKSELGVALIGTGFMGRLHSIAYSILPSFFPELPGVRRRVVADVTESLAQRGAKQFGYDEWAVGWEKVIARSDVDIVDIVAFNYRKCPAVLEAKRLIDEGALGKIFHFRALYLQDWAVSPETPFSWRFRADQSGSGALGDIGSHALDFALYLVGQISSVAGFTQTFISSRPKPGSSDMESVDVDDCALALVRFENGAVGTLEASRFSYGRFRRAFPTMTHGGA